MSLMGSFYVGVSGLQTSQNALNTTAHNLSNVNTTGYTRQQVLQGNQIYNKVGECGVGPMQIGLGVSYTDVRAVRDVFLDRSYRTQSGRSAYYSTSLEAINEINIQFGETEGTEFQQSLRELQNAITDLASKPTDATTQGVVVTRAAQFLERATAIYGGMAEYQDNLNEQIRDQVDQVNEYAKKIFELNQKINAIESGKQEDANDLRDTRDYYLDKLSAMGRISYSEDAHGSVVVQFEGVDLVNGDYVNQMEAKVMDEDVETGFYSVIWPKMNNQSVFNFSQEINASTGTDNGSLKALILSRGQGIATYAEVTDENGNTYGAVKNRRPTYEDITGYDNGVYIDENKNVFQRNQDDDPHLDPVTDIEAYSFIRNSSVSTVMAEFDNLIHNITAGIDKILTKNGGPALFSKLKADGTTDTQNPPYSYYDAYTCNNLLINSELLKQPTLLDNGFLLPDQSADQKMADELVALFNDPAKLIELFPNEMESDNINVKEYHAKVTLNATELTPLTFGDYYISIVDQYATIGNTYKALSESQEQSVLTLENERQQILGVSDNEELTKMVRFQNAYNASSRYMNTVNNMLDHLINNLGHF
ncbi:MAG: flagellar hook-associated protein FlgK [Lachnospiraceae bacterium]|nr:flagellar hook-associated protein FlgK [Lachnospiraceae bacterium]